MFATEQDDGYHGVELRTNKYYSYGYFEIDAKINASRGICPAFWLVGNRDSASKIEYEIDRPYRGCGLFVLTNALN